MLSSTISKVQYRIFMYFHIIMSILRDEEFCFTLNPIAKMLTSQFLDDFALEYGQEYIGYNLHTFSHLSDDCLKFGKVDNFSAFCFESYIHNMKQNVKGTRRPLQQIFNRVSEALNCFGISSKITATQMILSLPTGPDTFSMLKIRDTTLRVNEKDCYVQSVCKRKIIKIEMFKKIDGNVLVIGKLYKKFTNIYTLPINSSDINELRVFTNHTENITIHISRIKRKFYVIDTETEGVSLFFPLSSFI